MSVKKFKRGKFFPDFTISNQFIALPQLHAWRFCGNTGKWKENFKERKKSENVLLVATETAIKM